VAGVYVEHLSLTDFRSYPHVSLDLGPGATTFLGPNGHGKTNLVEAVGYAATLASHRVATDAPLVRSGATRAVVRVSVVRDARPVLLELEIASGRANRARVNRGVVPRARDVLGTLRTVTFAPEDLALVKGDPGERRRFLDDLLVARAPRLAGVRADVDRVLKQRNALLKSAGGSARAARGHLDVTTLDVWDAHLARCGAELVHARLDLVAALQPRLASAYGAVAAAADDEVAARYRSAVAGVTSGASRADLAAALLAEMAARRRDELDRGVSLVGPQRDDLALGLRGLPARGYASHGESWSLALGLRLASYDLLTDDGAAGAGGPPVLVLDDVFAELDSGRRARLATLVAGAEQVLVTAAVAADVPEGLRGARVEVSAGEARRVA
jgi:DNA replication and repair protein RecF